MNFVPVVLSGGSGTRLWPVSRASFPKQFSHLVHPSLMHQTLERLIPLGSPWVITHEGLKTLTLTTFKTLGLPVNQIVFEPMGRNTTPAIALICRLFQLQNRLEDIIGIFPADHLIANPSHFQKAIQSALPWAHEHHQLVTLGIRPTDPATGYGYIEVDAQEKAPGVRKTLGFQEKPSLEKAKSYVQSGRFFWNAGIFIASVKTWIQHLKQHWTQSWKLLETLQVDLSQLKSIYPSLESISIDYALAEKVSEQVCIPVDCGWSDLGSWDEVSQRVSPSCRTFTSLESPNSFIFSETSFAKTYALIDVPDTIVIDTNDALLLLKKGQSQKVKQVVELLESKHQPESRQHLFEHRPWGHFEILRDHPQFKSKIITVEPKQQLSYQSHQHRSEHWIIISGTAEVTLNDQIFQLQASEHLLIPQGAKHRVRNPGKDLLLLVEVQVGSYFGEEDIVRYEDDYQRI